MLAKARECERRRDWKGAAQHLEKALREGEDLGENVYTRLARSYRMSSHGRLADEALERGFDAYPSSEKLLMEKYLLDVSVRRWPIAKQTAEALIALKPGQSSSYFRLGQVHMWLNQIGDAEKAYTAGLEAHHGVPFDDIIAGVCRRIEAKSELDISTMTSTYRVMKGKNNLGFIWHEQGHRQYITKIMQRGRGSNREAFFYRTLRPTNPGLVTTSPRCVDLHEDDDITYLTLEVAGGEYGDSRFVQEVIEGARKISSVPYRAVAEHPVRSNDFVLRKGPASVFQFFSEIDQRGYNERLLNALRGIFEHNRYPPYAMDILSELESLILDNRLYMFLVRDLHFSLVHGDLTHENVKVDERSGVVTIFDWALFTFGPRFMDLARWFAASGSRVSYEVIQSEYLNDDGSSEQLSIIEQVFFLYAYILFHLLETSTDEDAIKEGLDKRMPEFIEPALDDLRILVTAFNVDCNTQTDLVERRITEQDQRLAEQGQGLAEQDRGLERLERALEDERATVAILEKRLARSVRSKKKSDRLLTDMFESGSWKITAPLRTFSKRLKRLTGSK